MGKDEALFTFRIYVSEVLANEEGRSTKEMVSEIYHLGSQLWDVA